MHKKNLIKNIKSFNSKPREYVRGGLSDSNETKVGLISMGQALRGDIKENIEDILEPDFELVCLGILDDYSYEQIVDRFWAKEGEPFIVSAIADGTTVIIDHSHAYKLINEKLAYLDRLGIEVKMLMCTGEFDDLEYEGILVQPSKMIEATLKGLGVNRIGIIVPEVDQIMDSQQQYRDFNPQIFAASPYEATEHIVDTSYKFDEDIQIILLDCMGFTMRMKNLVKTATGKNVILPRTLVAGLLYGIS